MPSANRWQFIENQRDLDNLNSLFSWGEDARVVELYGCMTTESYFPEEVAYSGMMNMNIHMLVELRELKNHGDPDFVELVLIDCNHIDSIYLSQPQFNGRVDSLKRINVDNKTMSCSRLIYRSVYEDHNPRSSTYFKHADSVT